MSAISPVSPSSPITPLDWSAAKNSPNNTVSPTSELDPKFVHGLVNACFMNIYQMQQLRN